MIVFSDARVIQSLNHPQVPAWIDFNLRAKINIITVHISAGAFPCGVVFHQYLQEAFFFSLFPQSPRGVSLSYINPDNVNPVSIYSGSEGGGAPPRGRCSRCPWKDGECVSASLSLCYLCVCMRTAEPFTDLSALFPRPGPTSLWRWNRHDS